MSKQGLSNNTRNYHPMITSFWMKPNLTEEQKKLVRQAAYRLEQEAKERAANEG